MVGGGVYTPCVRGRVAGGMVYIRRGVYVGGRVVGWCIYAVWGNGGGLLEEWRIYAVGRRRRMFGGVAYIRRGVRRGVTDG